MWDVCTCSVAKSCPTLCDPWNVSPLGSSVHGIFQERKPGWVTIFSSRGSSRPRDQTHVSCIDKWILYHWATWQALLSGTLVFIKLFHSQMMWSIPQTVFLQRTTFESNKRKQVIIEYYNCFCKNMTFQFTFCDSLNNM